MCAFVKLNKRDREREREADKNGVQDNSAT